MKPNTNWKLTCPENNILTVLRVIKKNSLRVLVLAFFPWMGPLSDILAHISLIVTKAYLLLCLIYSLTGQSLSSGMLKILFCGITVTFNISQVGGSPVVPEADGRHRSWKRRRWTGFDLFLVTQESQYLGWVLHSTEVAYLLLTRMPRVRFLSFPRMLSSCCWYLLMALLRTVDRGLITSIENI